MYFMEADSGGAYRDILCQNGAQRSLRREDQAAASACGAGRRPRVRDAEGAPKGRSRLAERGETER